MKGMVADLVLILTNVSYFVSHSSDCLCLPSCSALHDENNSNDESIKGKSLGEDHHKDKGDKDVVLAIGANTSITNNTDGETGSQ